ncbi:hypothetical protein IWX90DRAFT_414818 [Phyllosticta citrichinensis]|uniref:Uncharacterized protein n=1 Tax=Phyllosticta citrichinensis TaxID=1130410 RepID=A0ABR1XSY9_9PEZI
MASAFVAPSALPGGGGDPPRQPNNNNNNNNNNTGHRVEKSGQKPSYKRCGYDVHGHWKDCTRKCRRRNTYEHVGMPCSVRIQRTPQKNPGAVNEQAVKLSTDLYQETRGLRE